MPRLLALVDSINNQLTQKKCQNVISLFWPNKPLCKVILPYDDSKRHFLQVLYFPSLSSKMSGVPIPAPRGCVSPRYGVGLFLTSKLKGLNIFWKRFVIMPFLGFFEREKIPLLKFSKNLLVWGKVKKSQNSLVIFMTFCQIFRSIFKTALDNSSWKCR